jgi:hypothetical protein
VGTVVRGVGNEEASGVEGAWAGHVLGTYLHGPVLARNPRLADLLLTWALGPLPPLEVAEADRLHDERVRHGDGRQHAILPPHVAAAPLRLAAGRPPRARRRRCLPAPERGDDGQP